MTLEPVVLEPIAVLIVDDSEDLRTLVRETLLAHGGFAIAGEAADGEQAIVEAGRSHPDLVLLDLGLPNLGGLEALPAIRAAAPGAVIVILSGLPEDGRRDVAIAGGAAGYLGKGISGGELVSELLALAGVVGTVDAALAELPGHDASPRAARRLAQAAIERWNCTGALETVTLLVSEVVTNAVLHARSDVQVTVRLLPSAVRIEVTDGSAEPPVPRQPEVGSPGGRGLLMVESLSRAWGVDPSGAGKIVWFEVDRLDAAAVARTIE